MSPLVLALQQILGTYKIDTEACARQKGANSSESKSTDTINGLAICHSLPRMWSARTTQLV